MATTWADVVAVAPELSNTPAGSQTALLGYAVGQCDPIAWGLLLKNGVVYLAAHLATLARLRGSGVVTKETIDRLSREYAKPYMMRGSLGLTAYGQEYLRLTRLLPTALGVVF